MDDVEYRTEFSARERAGGDIEEGLELFGPATFKGMEGDPVQRFYNGIESAGRNLIRDGHIKLNKQEQNRLLSSVLRITYPNYKNPMGTVLGFYVTEGGRGPIDKGRLSHVQSFMEEVTDMDLRDLIRYCRLWLALK
ncbi:hypothetical protein [Common midwife toad virus]|uniref:Uncharacterized protein n=1 Tax=Common midwife toad virus TaxID=540070 RepID=A0A2D0XMM8_9VIRU|nr:hypothetical protein [Common midwife toad virus]